MSEDGRNGKAAVFKINFNRIAPFFSLQELVQIVEGKKDEDGDSFGMVTNDHDLNGMPTTNLTVMLARDHDVSYDVLEVLKFGEGRVANLPLHLLR